MAKFLKWCCGGCFVLALLAVVAAIVAWRWAGEQPRQWTTEATVEIAAAPEDVLPLVEQLDRWPEWSAWARDRAPEIDATFSGPASGVGASVLWTEEREHSDTPYAHGRLEITAAGPSGIEYRSWHYGRLTFASWSDDGRVHSESSVAISDFDHDYVVPGSLRIEPTETGCRVTWSETVDLGDSVIARGMALTLVPIARRAHASVLELSLAGLKDRAELR